MLLSPLPEAFLDECVLLENSYSSPEENHLLCNQELLNKEDKDVESFEVPSIVLEAEMEERVYNADEFLVEANEKPLNRNRDKNIKPPSFKEGLAQIPENLQSAFEKHLHGKLVGIWPITDNLWRP